MSDRTWYEILGVDPGAGDDEIKAAYRSRAWSSAGAASQEEIRLLNDAYAVLSSPDRRAAYDRGLADRDRVQAPVASPGPAPAPPLATALAPATGLADEGIPRGPWLLRLWGRFTPLFWHLSHARYYFIPFSLVLTILLIGLGAYLVKEREVILRDPEPATIALQEAVRNVPEDRYVRISGTVDHETGYVVTGDVNEYYSVLYSPPSVLYVKGYKTDQGPEIAGRMRPFDSDLGKRVRDDAKDPYWEGVELLTTHYLDSTYKPGNPALYSTGILLIAAFLLLMLLASVRRYTAFAAADLGPGEVALPPLPLPMRVEATGKFRPAERRGGGVFLAAMPVIVTPVDEPEAGLALEVWLRKGKEERLHVINIPPGSPVRTGLDHTGGSTRPALAIRAGGQTVVLRLESMAAARGVAQMIAGQPS